MNAFNQSIEGSPSTVWTADLNLPTLGWVLAGLTTLMASGYYLYPPRRTGQLSSAKSAEIRAMLPNDLDTWRVPGPSREDEERIWRPLEQVFLWHGLKLWKNVHNCMLKAPDDTYISAAGFSYATPSRGTHGGPGTAKYLSRFECNTPLTRIARSSNGQDLCIKLVVLKKEGYEHLKVLRRLTTSPLALISTNHALPRLGEICFEDLIFVLFPRVGGDIVEAFGYWPNDSVGDLVDMLMQALEALVFIHDLRIAHRDAFCDNYLVQWHPESMRTMSVPVSRPRVYMIDFEVAVEFPSESPSAECLLTGYPLGGSFLARSQYARPPAPEMVTGGTYSPFKLDVWQLGQYFSKWSYKTTIDKIDRVIGALVHSDWKQRMSAAEALEKLQNAVNSLPPSSLLIPPSHTLHHWAQYQILWAKLLI